MSKSLYVSPVKNNYSKSLKKVNKMRVRGLFKNKTKKNLVSTLFLLSITYSTNKNFHKQK